MRKQFLIQESALLKRTSETSLKRALVSLASFFSVVFLFGFLENSYADDRLELLKSEQEYLASPFESENQHPLELMHRVFQPTSPFALREGQLLFSIDGAWASTVTRRQSSYLFDAETRQIRPFFRYGLGNQIELGGDLPLLWRGGGFTDPLIDDWHQGFGLPRGPRQFVPDDTFVLQGDTRNGGKYRESRDGLGLRDAQLNAKAELHRSSDSVLSVQLAGSLPTGRLSYGQSSSDLSAGLLGSYHWDELWLSSGAGISYFLDPWEKNLEFQREQIRGFLGASYFFSERLSVYLGLNAGGALLKNIERFPDYQIYLDLGVKRKIAEKTFISFLMRENPAPGQATTDVEFQLGLAYLFSR